MGRIERLRESKRLLAANNAFYYDGGGNSNAVDGSGAPAGDDAASREVYFDSDFVDLFKSCAGKQWFCNSSSYYLDSITRAAVTISKRAPKKAVAETLIDKSQLEQSNAQITMQETRIAQLEALVLDLRQQLSSQVCLGLFNVKFEQEAGFLTTINEQTARIQELEGSQPHTGSGVAAPNEGGGDESMQTRLQEIEQEQEDLLVCLAEQDIEVKRLKDMLRAYGEVFEEEEPEDCDGALDPVEDDYTKGQDATGHFYTGVVDAYPANAYTAYPAAADPYQAYPEAPDAYGAGPVPADEPEEGSFL